MARVVFEPPLCRSCLPSIRHPDLLGHATNLKKLLLILLGSVDAAKAVVLLYLEEQLVHEESLQKY